MGDAKGAEGMERAKLSSLTRRLGLRTVGGCVNRRQSRKLAAGQRIVRKYRKFARNLEYRRLRSIVPAVANKEGATRAEILEEAIRYIDCLHERLVQSVRENGLPPSLRQAAVAQINGNNEAPTPPPSTCSSSSSRLSSDGIIGLVQSSLRPDIEKRLKVRKQLEQAAIEGILRRRNVASASEVPVTPVTPVDTPESPSPTKAAKRGE